MLVSTLDGKLSAINSSGHLSWEIETGPGPLLISNIHKLEVKWIHSSKTCNGFTLHFSSIAHK